MNKLMETLAHNTSAFRQMAICALVIGLGDVLCAVSDLVWLFGDMAIQVHPHHYYVLVGLLVANVLIFGSFVWLFKSIYIYAINHDSKVKAKRVHKAKISKQSEVLGHLNRRILVLEEKTRLDYEDWLDLQTREK